MMTRSGNAQTAAPEAPGDFTNLINLLLAPSTASQASSQDVAPNETGSQDNAASSSSAPPAVPPAQLADSLIRSMFPPSGITPSGIASSGFTAHGVALSGQGSSSNAGSISKKTAPGTASQPAQPAVDTTASTAPVVPPVLNALMQSPLIQSADTSGGTSRAPVKGNAPAFSEGVVVNAPVSKAAPSAPLAFALRLTPSEAVAPAPNSQLPNAPAPHAKAPNVQVLRAQAPHTQAPAIAEAAAATPKPATQPASQPRPAESPAPVAEPQPQGAEPQPQGDTAQPEPKPSTQTSEIKPRQEANAREASAPAPVAAVADTAMNENANSFLNPPPNPSSLQPATKTQAVGGAPVPSAVEALRAAAPAAPAASAHASAPVREIAVRIASPQAPAVDVHLIERGGQINVAVRTPDGGLQTSLRQDLGSLVNSLERAGYRAEAFAPRDGVQQASISTQTNSQNSREESQTGSGDRGTAFGDSQQGGQQQQKQRDPRAAKWIEELENQQ